MPARAPSIVAYAAEEDSSARTSLLPLQEAGFDVRRADSPREALDLASAASLVLIEGSFPELPAFCRQLRGDPATAAAGVLLLSDEEPAGFDGGPDAFLPRAASPARVLAQVRLLLRLRLAEETSRGSESRLQNILDHAPVAVSVKDDLGRYLLVNRCWEAHFHHRREQVLGRTVFEVFPPDEAERVADRYRDVLATGSPVEYEEVAEQPEGRHTYLKTKFALRENGGPIGVCGIAVDITERKRVEQALRNEQALYHSLVETLPVCIFRKDLAGRFTFVNERFCQEIHRSASAILGRCDKDFFPDDLARKYTRDDHEVTTTGQVFECVEEHVAPEGQKHFVHVIKSPLHDAGGTVIGMQGMFWDVTDREQAQEELARAFADTEVAHRVQQKFFPAARGPLVREAAARGFDVGGVSYPLAAVGGDYYDYFPLDADRLAVAIGDVSGHGTGPALLMAIARAYLRASARADVTPGDVLERVNRLLANDVEGDRYITLLLAWLDMGTRSLTYASAGHATGFILDAAGQVKHRLDSTGVPLGISTSEAFPNSAAIALAAGDIVLLLTDGVTDSRAPDRVAFDEEHVLNLVRFYRCSSARQIAANLHFAARAFAQNHPQLDDSTAVIIKVNSEDKVGSR